MANQVKLLGVTGSPFSCRVQIALKLKGVEYEYIQEQDVYGNKSPLLLKYNPVLKKIPVFIHGDKPVVESLVIVEYIDETWEGTSILPKNPYERATARFWAKYIDDKSTTVLRDAFWTQGEQKEKAIKDSEDVLKTLENELASKGKKFFGGDTIGFADIAGIFLGFWLGMLEEVTGTVLVTKEKLPKLSAWIDEFQSCEAVKESLPPREVPLNFLRARFSKTN